MADYDKIKKLLEEKKKSEDSSGPKFSIDGDENLERAAEKRRKHWETVEKNMNAVINLKKKK